MRSEARGDVVADELVVAKGVTVDTVVDGDEGKDMVYNVEVSENQTSVNACTFSSADDIKIYKIGHNIRDKFVVTSAGGMRFQANVLSLYHWEPNLPRPGHEKVPRSGYFIETCSDYYYVQSNQFNK